MLTPRARNIDAHDGWVSRVPSVGQLLVEMKMEVADQHLVAGYRLVVVFVSVREHRLLRRAAVFCAEVEIDRHVLLGSRRRIVEREVIDVVVSLVGAFLPDRVGDPIRPVGLLVLGHARSHGERGLAILAVINEA